MLMHSDNTAIYIGVTDDLSRRLYEHKKHLVEGFTAKYNVTKLVYYEITNDVNSAIAREKQLKNWHREWKLNLIREKNPYLKDLSDDLEL